MTTMTPILLDATEEARLVVTAALPLTPGHPGAALSTYPSTWFDDNLQQALAAYGLSPSDPGWLLTVILPFADEQAAQDTVRRWEAAGLASKGTVIDVWGVRDAGTDAAAWECREADVLGLGDGSGDEIADLWPEA